MLVKALFLRIALQDTGGLLRETGSSILANSIDTFLIRRDLAIWLDEHIIHSLEWLLFGYDRRLIDEVFIWKLPLRLVHAHSNYLIILIYFPIVLNIGAEHFSVSLVLAKLCLIDSLGLDDSSGVLPTIAPNLNGSLEVYALIWGPIDQIDTTIVFILFGSQEDCLVRLSFLPLHTIHLVYLRFSLSRLPWSLTFRSFSYTPLFCLIQLLLVKHLSFSIILFIYSVILF